MRYRRQVNPAADKSACVVRMYGENKKLSDRLFGFELVMNGAGSMLVYSLVHAVRKFVRRRISDSNSSRLSGLVPVDVLASMIQED
jgi:hypothetical protein